jgi:hypothetical protein
VFGKHYGITKVFGKHYAITKGKYEGKTKFGTSSDIFRDIKC